jgi:two-component system C4-dicarboxylate transport sensor histidine kinase DctB
MFKRSFITIVLLLGLMLLLSIVSEYSKQNAIDALQLRTQADLNRYVLTLRQKLARFKDIPQLLSTHPDLMRVLRSFSNSNDVTRANYHLANVNKILGTRDSYVMNAQGITVASSNWDTEHSFVGGDFHYRPYFTAAMAGNLGQYFALGSTSNKRGFFFSYPMTYMQKIIGVIVVKIDVNEIERDWNEKAIELLVSDEDGVIFISTRKDWKFKTLKSLQAEDLRRIEQSRRYTGQALIPLNITSRLTNENSNQVITMREQKDSQTEQRYLIQSSTVGNSDLNVSILADLETVQAQVLANMLYVGTV